LGRAENARAAQSLRDLGFVSAIDLLSSYAGSAPDLAAWFQGAAINTDRSLRLQYLAGMSVNVYAQEQITSALLNARKIPPGLFAGSAETVAKLREAIEGSGAAYKAAAPYRASPVSSATGVARAGR
jgi:spermidine synthase